MLVGAFAQHIGPRGEQQDHVFSEPGLHAIADGNGLLGDCSQLAVSLFRKHLHEARSLGVAADRAIEKAVRCANDELCAYLREEVANALESWKSNESAMQAVEMLGVEFFENELGSGSTLVALVEDRHIVHVGDSRAYLVSPARGELTLLTRDHVWTRDDQTVEIEGTIYKHGLAMARVLGHPQLAKHGVTAEPDLRTFELPPGDVLLLCSDGLRPFLEKPDDPSRLCALLAAGSLDEVARLVIEEAAAIASDNVSLLLVGR